MKNEQFLTKSMLVLILALFTLTSCDKEEIIDYSTEINANETKTIVKFRILEGETVDQIILSGTLREYEEADIVSGAVTIRSFAIESTSLGGNFRDGDLALMIPGDPIPGIDITVEQSPGGISSTSTNLDGYFSIRIDNPSSGLYSLTINGESSKDGFVINDFNH